MKTAMALFAVGAMSTAACSGEAVGDGKGAGGGLLGGLADTKDKNGQTTNGGPTTTTPTKDGPPATTTANGGGGGGGKACYDTGNATCDSCVNAKCCASIGACTANAACSALLQCLEPCGSDATCQNYCAQQYSAGVSLFQSASQCVRSSCGGVCGG